jgi:glycosyltransferase involved in cell wall biosynthesis
MCRNWIIFGYVFHVTTIAPTLMRCKRLSNECAATINNTHKRLITNHFSSNTLSAQPFFSIIIPAYNRSELLGETLDSVQTQSFAAWECIVVDDGSTDNTRQVVEDTAASDSRIRYVYQNNAERSAARNNGIWNARGRYICFLDSDDHFSPVYLERLHAFLAAKDLPKALVITDFCIWNGANNTPIDVPPIVNNVAEWLFQNPVSPSRACLHNEILKRFQFREDIVMVEDSVLWVSVASEFPVLHLQECLVWYRVHDGNSVNRATPAAFRRHAGLRLFFKDPLSRAISNAAKRDLLSDVRFRMAEYHSLKNKRLKTVCTAMWSLMTSPGHRHTKAKIFLMLQQVPGFNLVWK